MSTYAYTTTPNYRSTRAPFQPFPPAVGHRYSYLPHNPSPAEVESYHQRVQKPRLARPTNSRYDANGSTKSASNQFLDVHPTPTYHRRRMGHARTDSHSSTAPSLTRSYSSEEEDLPRSGPTTPYSANVVLWRDDVQTLDDVSAYASPYDEFGYLGKRRYEPASSGPRISEAEVEATCLAIENMVYELNDRVLAFTFPKKLDIEESSGGPRLAYTPRNRPLLEHREYLERLLTRLDDMPSYGNQRIANARKEAATITNQQLDQLERMEKMVRHNLHYERWKKTPRIQVTEPTLP
ncbi:hypothetical protein FRC09_015814 [Ceratobasidium sp. 395]|nr:hypothetical protein FRC09_015814 [Ceratobasidium sp. 395]